MILEMGTGKNRSDNVGLLVLTIPILSVPLIVYLGKAGAYILKNFWKE